jgi:hypothetical protein
MFEMTAHFESPKQLPSPGAVGRCCGSGPLPAPRPAASLRGIQRRSRYAARGTAGIAREPVTGHAPAFALSQISVG